MYFNIQYNQFKNMSKNNIQKALQDLQKGKFVIVYDADGREEECDFFLDAKMCTYLHIQTMRKYGGGLIFLMVSPGVKAKLKLPYLHDMQSELSNKYEIFKELIPNDIPYDTKSSFSISINHRKTFTGITDNDRALTVSEFGKMADAIEYKTSDQAIETFGQNFRSPGHVPFCLADDNILEKRFGHTELGCAMSILAGLNGVMVGCEIMADNGGSMPKKQVEQYARDNNIPFLEGREIVDVWKKKN